MNGIIIDVRERDEFKQGHIKDSINMPLSELATAAPALIAGLAGKDVLLVCTIGKRSEKARLQLEAMGLGSLCKLSNFAGGINNWNVAERPVIVGRHSVSSWLYARAAAVAGALWKR